MRVYCTYEGKPIQGVVIRSAEPEDHGEICYVVTQLEMQSWHHYRKRWGGRILDIVVGDWMRAGR